MGIENSLQASLEKAKYNLSKNLSLLSTVMLLTISVVYFFESDKSSYLIFTGGIISFFSYLTIIKTKRHYFPALACLILLSLLNILNLSVASNFHHIGDYFWAICIVTSAFFLLGRVWGIILISFNLLNIFAIFYLVRNGYLTQIPKDFTDFSQINFFINLCIGGTLFSFLIIEFLKQNKEIAKKYIQANEELTILNAEKTVMLKEIHHRVKNNLQIVTSLLRLQSSEMDDPRVENEFSEAIDRIAAIAKIHDKMYNNKSLNQIDLSDYLEDLIKDLVESYRNEKKIATEITTNINAIPPKDLVPIALIFNELVTNTVKHAYRNQPDCLIQIDAFVTDENQVRISYRDNGTWAEPNEGHKSIGLELIESFVDQLDGSYTIDKSDGTHYIIRYAIKE